MIGQYLSNTNEIATVLILPKNLELNKALVRPGHKSCITFSFFPILFDVIMVIFKIISQNFTVSQ